MHLKSREINITRAPRTLSVDKIRRGKLKSSLTRTLPDFSLRKKIYRDLIKIEGNTLGIQKFESGSV